MNQELLTILKALYNLHSNNKGNLHLEFYMPVMGHRVRRCIEVPCVICPFGVYSEGAIYSDLLETII